MPGHTRSQIVDYVTVLDLDSHIVTNSDHLKPSKLGWYIAKKMCLIFSYGQISRSQFWVHFQCILDLFCSKLSYNITIYVTRWCETSLKSWEMFRDKICMYFSHKTLDIACRVLCCDEEAQNVENSKTTWMKYTKKSKIFGQTFGKNHVVRGIASTTTRNSWMNFNKKN